MMAQPDRTTGSRRWLDDDQVDTHDRTGQPPPVGQGAALDQPADGGSQLGPLPPIERLLGQAVIAARPPSDLDEHDGRRWAWLEGDDVDLRSAEADVPAGNGPAQPGEVIGDQRLGGVARALDGRPPARRAGPGPGGGFDAGRCPGRRRSDGVIHPTSLARPAHRSLTGAASTFATAGEVRGRAGPSSGHARYGRWRRTVVRGWHTRPWRSGVDADNRTCPARTAGPDRAHRFWFASVPAIPLLRADQSHRRRGPCTTSGSEEARHCG